ncbi:hypothetical protein Mnod_2335 [Methylobacterium nodulans ORS 2060]|uniref:Uncharacterized protein n=1 Tax=Methylobacterium nodulans (strain LMG 21967 / CNCM I-2342 / ORS 2060) TaxID=460265 RepID=B8IB96_METNO|nr:hypothetical protein Mnod_2335 [Methylobacterium nodulans ORS 2060]
MLVAGLKAQLTENRHAGAALASIEIEDGHSRKKGEDA